MRQHGVLPINQIKPIMKLLSIVTANIFIICALMAPAFVSADQYTGSRTYDLLGSCPVYVSGVEIGRAYAEPYGILPQIDIERRDPNRAYANELAVFLRIINRNDFNDRLRHVSMPIALKTSIKKIEYLKSIQNPNDRNDIRARKIAVTIDYIDLPGGRLVVGDLYRSDAEYLSMIELRPDDRFIHATGIDTVLTYGETIDLDLTFDNAGKVTVPVQIRRRPQKDALYRRDLPWPDCQ